MDGFTQAIRIILQGSADLKGFEAANAQLSTLSANLKKTGTNFDKLGLELTFLGGGMALSAGIAIKAASGFEQEMAKISAVLGEQSEQFIPRYRSQLLTLASTVPTDTVSELAGALEKTIMAGIPAAKAMQVLTVASSAATAASTKTATTLNTITSILDAYKMSAEQAAHVSDVLIKSHELGKASFEDMASALGKVMGLAAEVNVSFEQVAAATVTLSKQGIRAGMATAGLTFAMQSINKPSSEATKMANALGIELSATKLQSMGLQNYLQYLQTATKGNTQNFAMLLGGARGLRIALGLTGDNASGAAHDLMEMTQASGATHHASEKMTSTLNSLFERLKNSLEALKIKLGEPLLKPIKDVMAWTLKAVDALREFAGTHPLLTKLGMGAFTAASGMFLLLVPTLIVSGTLLKMGGAITGMLPKLMHLAEAMHLAIAPGTGLVGVLRAICGSLLTTLAPLLSVIAITGMLFLAWKTNFLGMRDVTVALWSALRPLIVGLIGSIKSFAMVVAGEVVNTIRSILQLFGAWNENFTGMKSPLLTFGLMVAFAFGFIAGFIRGFLALLTKNQYAWTLMWVGAGLFAVKLFNLGGVLLWTGKLIAGLPGLLTGFAGAIDSAAKAVGRFAENPAAAFTALKNLFTNGATAATSFATRMWAAMGSAANAVWSFAVRAATGIWQWMVSMVTAIRAVITSLWSLGVNLVKTGAQVAWFVIKWIAAKVAMLAHAVATGVVTAAQWLLNVAMSANPIGLIIIGVVALGAAIYLLYKHWNTVWGWIKQVAFVAILGIVAPFYLIWKHWDIVLGWLKTGISAVGNFFSHIWDSIKQAGMNAADWVIEKINWLIGKINAISSVLGFQIPLIPTFSGPATIPIKPATIPVEIKTYTKDANLVHHSPYTVLTQQALIPVVAALDPFFLKLQDTLTKTITTLLDQLSGRLEQFVFATQQLSGFEPSFAFAGGGSEGSLSVPSSSVVTHSLFQSQRHSHSTAIDRSIRIDAINISGVSAEQGESIREQIVAALLDALSATDGVEEASIG